MKPEMTEDLKRELRDVLARCRSGDAGKILDSERHALVEALTWLLSDGVIVADAAPTVVAESSADAVRLQRRTRIELEVLREQTFAARASGESDERHGAGNPAWRDAIEARLRRLEDLQAASVGGKEKP